MQPPLAVDAAARELAGVGQGTLESTGLFRELPPPLRLSPRSELAIRRCARALQAPTSRDRWEPEGAAFGERWLPFFLVDGGQGKKSENASWQTGLIMA